VIGNFLGRAIGREKTDLCVAMIVVLKVDAAIVGGPDWILDVEVEFVGDGMGARAVALH